MWLENKFSTILLLLLIAKNYFRQIHDSRKKSFPMTNALREDMHYFRPLFPFEIKLVAILKSYFLIGKQLFTTTFIIGIVSFFDDGSKKHYFQWKHFRQPATATCPRKWSSLLQSIVSLENERHCCSEPILGSCS